MGFEMVDAADHNPLFPCLRQSNPQDLRRIVNHGNVWSAIFPPRVCELNAKHLRV